MLLPIGGRSSAVIKLGEMIMILDLYRQGLHPASKLVAIARTPRRSIQLSCCNSTVLRKRLTRSALRLVDKIRH